MSIIMAFELDTTDPSVRENMPFKNDGAYMIPRIMDSLDKLALRENVTPISQFVRPDIDTMEHFREALEEEGEDTSQYDDDFASARASQGRWYDPGDALPSFRAVKSHVDSDPTWLQSLAQEDRYLDADDFHYEFHYEMDGFIKCLEYLESCGVRFCFDVG